jgi:hypothetical protein
LSNRAYALRAALGRAVKRQLVVRNVALLVDLPAKSGWEMQPLDEHQVHLLQRAIEGDRHDDDAHGISPALITETPQVSTRAGSGGV